MSQLSIDKVKFSYKDKIIFQDLSHSFESSKIYGVLGLNGSGKTTFYNLVKRNLIPISGEIKYDGITINKDHSYFLETANYHYPYTTGREHLALFDQGTSIIPFDKMNKIFDLPLDDLIENYSTGMKKKLAIMSMLLYDRPIYLLDEPFNGLDMETNKILETIVKLIKEKNKIVLITSHILQPLLNICDEIILLKNQETTVYFKNDFEKLEDLLLGDMEAKVRALITD
jgi:ABC-2 type transport system ATP-binding protein